VNFELQYVDHSISRKQFFQTAFSSVTETLGNEMTELFALCEGTSPLFQGLQTSAVCSSAESSFEDGDDYGSRVTRYSRQTTELTCSSVTFPPQISHVLPWVRALPFGTNDFRLASLDMAWPIKPENKCKCIETSVRTAQ